jgi:hypothetical protein
MLRACALRAPVSDLQGTCRTRGRNIPVTAFGDTLVQDKLSQQRYGEGGGGAAQEECPFDPVIRRKKNKLDSIFIFYH